MVGGGVEDGGVVDGGVDGSVDPGVCCQKSQECGL